MLIDKSKATLHDAVVDLHPIWVDCVDRCEPGDEQQINAVFEELGALRIAAAKKPKGMESVAISLKRIADALDTHNQSTTLTDLLSNIEMDLRKGANI